jgi:4-hydroxy 2-oxovalerate aldolase
MFENLKILDCTIRDGGYINNWNFSVDFGKALYWAVSSSGCEYVELGFSSPLMDKASLFRNCDSKLINEIRGSFKNGARVSLLVDFSKELTADLFPRQGDLGADILRIVTRKADAERGAELAAQLAGKGYETSVNFMGISNYTPSEMNALACLMEKYKKQVTYFYLADSFGSLIPSKLRDILKTIRSQTNAPLGFHPHNNLQLAFANTLEAIQGGVSIIDGSVNGMGRGGGNLPIETLLLYLGQVSPTRYNALPLLDFAEIYMEPLKKQYKWGNSLAQVVSGALNCHPNYAGEMLKLKIYSAKEVFLALSKIPFDERAEFNREKNINVAFQYKIEKAKKLMPVTTTKVRGLVGSSNGKVLIACGGGTLGASLDSIRRFVDETKCAVVCVNNNFLPERTDAVFFGSARRLRQNYQKGGAGVQVILNPYIEIDEGEGGPQDTISRIPIDAFSLNKEYVFPHKLPTNSGVQAILSMAAIGFKEIYVAGMDGFSPNERNLFYYPNSDSPEKKAEDESDEKRQEFETLNQMTHKELETARVILAEKSAAFWIITPTIFQKHHRVVWEATT